VRLGQKRLSGNNRHRCSASRSASLPGLARSPERVASQIRLYRYFGFDKSFTTGARTWCIRYRYEKRSLASDRDRNENEPKLALFGVPFRHPPGVSWLPTMNVGGSIDNCLVGTRLSDDSTRDG